MIQGASYGPADPVRVTRETQKLLKTAEELGVTHFREGYPITRQAADWGDVAARYAAVVLTDGAAKATLVPELEGRIVAVGRANILRVPDPGEWAYPHAGGISVSLYDGDLPAPRSVAWQRESVTRETVTLTGRADSGRALHLQIGIAGDALRMRVTVSNPTDSPALLRILCRAEFACGPSREAALTYRDRSGKERNAKDSFRRWGARRRRNPDRGRASPRGVGACLPGPGASRQQSFSGGGGRALRFQLVVPRLGRTEHQYECWESGN